MSCTCPGKPCIELVTCTACIEFCRDGHDCGCPCHESADNTYEVPLYLCRYCRISILDIRRRHGSSTILSEKRHSDLFPTESPGCE